MESKSSENEKVHGEDLKLQEVERGEGDAKSDMAPKEEKDARGSSADDTDTHDRNPLEEAVTEMDLVKLIENMKFVKDNENGTRDRDSIEFLERRSKLEQLRMESLKEKQAVRRTAWKEEVTKKTEKYALLKSKMLDTLSQEPVVTNWKDKVAICKIDLGWRKELKNGRIQFLFNAVFPLLYKSPGLTISQWDIKNCRLVSKKWKQSIDHCLSTTLEMYTKRRDKSFHFYYNDDLIPFVHSFYSLSAIQSFNNWGQQIYRGTNPLYSRKLRIGFVDGEWKDNLRYWKEMDKLLQSWGKEIWQVFILFHTGMTAELMYECLVKYLKLMPNLRDVFIYDRDRSQMLKLEMLKDLRSDVHGPLKERMSRNPLPELPHLRTIFFRNVPDPLIHDALEKYGPHLESVSVYGCGLDVDPGEFAIGKKLPSMTFFCVVADSGRTSPLTYDFPQVEEMSLEYYLLKGRAEMENIFKSLNSCGSTMRELRLSTNSYLEEVMINGSVKLELPHLEWLCMSTSLANLKSFNFLLPLVSLKYLDLKIMSRKLYELADKYDPPNPNEEIIQFKGYLSRLYESNIWKLFPELRLVTIKVTPEWAEHTLSQPIPWTMQLNMPVRLFYTRDGYQKYCDKWKVFNAGAKRVRTG